jgi:hypothetical protein
MVPECYNRPQHRRRESWRLRRKPRTVAKVDAMKGSRTWSRREFSVTSNELFSILRPAEWFAIVRLPGGFRYRVGQPQGTTSPLANENPTENATAAPPPESTFVPGQKALDHADIQDTAIPSQIRKLSADDRRLMRTALIVLAATAVASILLGWLWWICSS